MLHLDSRVDLVLDLDGVEEARRVAFWSAQIDKRGGLISQLDPEEMSRVKSPPGRIVEALEKASHEVGWRRPSLSELKGRLLRNLQSTSTDDADLASGELTVPNRTLQDLCLAPEVMERFHRVIRSIKGRSQLLAKWNLDPGMVGRAQGIVLLHGVSGSGKSLAGEVLADSLGLPLFRMEASELESPFVAESEQRLVKFFSNAKGRSVVLMLDEADSLLMDRSRAEGSTRRYQINLVNTWLRELDRFEGVLVLTTNNQERMDPACERRISHRMEFPRPTPAVRAMIWRNFFDKTQVPGRDSLDLEKVADAFPFTGGRIRLAFVNALQRASEDGAISQETLWAACLEESHSGLHSESNRRRILGFASQYEEVI